jgi:predicted Rossmann fold flavoprotein
MTEERLPVVVVGAGAAGFMAAIFAARPDADTDEGLGSGRRVILLERTKDGGRKILMSGGGRCNVLPSNLEPARFVTASSPHTLKKLLLAWPHREQRRFFEERLQIPLALEKETGKLFPVSNRARDVRDSLRAMAERFGVEVRGDSFVTGLAPDGDAWRVLLDGGAEIRARAVILCSGGLSVPATGSDGTGLNIARALGHTIHETYPALTPLTAEPHRYAGLAGISLTVTLEAPGGARPLVTHGGFLFTHKGYSGPAVLDISHRAVLSKRAGGPRQRLLVRWTELTAEAWDRKLREEEGTMAGILREWLPARLVEALLQDASVAPSTTRSQLRREERVRLVETLTRHPLFWTGDEGYKRAEVTGGGVALDEIDPRTLESKLRPGLYLCGEILDAFGPIGGHNFSWAWATARAAGRAAASR